VSRILRNLIVGMALLPLLLGCAARLVTPGKTSVSGDAFEDDRQRLIKTCGEQPKPGRITIGGIRQDGEVGGRCWARLCGSPIAWPTNSTPLKARSPIALDLELSDVAAMTHLEYWIVKVDESARYQVDPSWKEKLPPDIKAKSNERDTRVSLWRPKVDSVLKLKSAARQTLELDLPKGLYVMTFFGWWKGCGDSTHGFLIEIE
jgi:hypothetical protein